MTDEKKKPVLIAEIDEHELIVRIVEAMGSCRRPPDVTNAEIIKTLPAEELATLRDTARTAMTYFAECLSKAMRPQ